MIRDRAYFALMGSCIAAVILAWTVVRLLSVTAAVVISVCAGISACYLLGCGMLQWTFGFAPT
jgi:hypothetical protein